MARERKIFFSAFEVSEQVFLTTRHSFALVNLKPLLPGHVLICPFHPHKRLTDLSADETTDLFRTVQTVQRLLARHYFQKVAEAAETRPPSTPPGTETWEQNGAANGRTASPTRATPIPEDGSFNIAIQDGVGAGQTVPHVHVHVIPRIRNVNAKDPSGEGDVLYEMMAREEGNVGGALWDREVAADGPAGERLGGRPTPGGSFPRIEDCNREARSRDEMVAEAELYKEVLRKMDE